MSEYDYDLFVIGAGSGGVRAARLAANMGLKVGVVELKEECSGFDPRTLFYIYVNESARKLTHDVDALIGDERSCDVEFVADLSGLYYDCIDRYAGVYYRYGISLFAEISSPGSAGGNDGGDE